MILTNNIPAIRVNAQLGRTNRLANTSMARLSSGMRVNNASDDPAAMSIANRIRREINGLGAANQNALDGVSLIQTADGALNEVHAILGRIRELAVQGANDTMTNMDREMFQQEIDQLLDEIENIGQRTAFNGRSIFSGIFEDANGNEHGVVPVRIGTGKDNLMDLRIAGLSMHTLGAGSGVAYNGPPRLDEDGNVITEIRGLASALHSGHGGRVFYRDDNGDPHESGRWLSTSLDLMDRATAEISEMRSSMGAYENRLEQTSSVIGVTSINMQSGLSRMVDTDMALEMARLTQQNVISQAAVSVLSMANQRPQQMLSLLNF